MGSFISLYKQLKQQALNANHRRLLCFHGEPMWAIQQASIIVEQQSEAFVWCGSATQSITETPYLSLLGQDVSLLVLNMVNGFDANMFAASEGAVKGGGVIILLLPCSGSSDNFSQYMMTQLKQHKADIVEQDLPLPVIDSINTNNHLSHPLQTEQQQQAVQHIIKTVTGHRRRPLVLTANRGRGKSAALGIASAQLINQGCEKIIVCAPSKRAAQTLYQHAQLNLQNAYEIKSIEFYPPDLLATEQPTCSLLIIDEAAAIPLKLLTLFTRHYSRIVFASTLFGYEGSGRGFALRFQKKLQQLAPEWRQFQLQQPIRWNNNDPVETFTLQSLCLVGEPTASRVAANKQSIKLIKQSDLLNQPKLLKRLFSLLVNAHYQTKPSDLSALLNDKDLSIIAVFQDINILAVALINHEGGFDQATSQQIYLGKRRPTGHLFPQSLAYHSGFEQVATHHFARIQRIAVQPELQNQGLGKTLIRWIKKWAIEQNMEHLSASFAASEPLLKFWLTQGFQVLRIGTQKDKSSGEHSMMVNLPLNTVSKSMHQQIQQAFVKQLPTLLSRQLSYLPSSLLTILWPQIIKEDDLTTIRSKLIAYINANRAYENVEYLLLELVLNTSLHQLSKQQQQAVIEKVIQNHSWQELAETQKFTGKKQAHAFIKQAIHDLITLTDNHETR